MSVFVITPAIQRLARMTVPVKRKPSHLPDSLTWMSVKGGKVCASDGATMVELSTSYSGPDFSMRIAASPVLLKGDDAVITIPDKVSTKRVQADINNSVGSISVDITPHTFPNTEPHWQAASSVDRSYVDVPFDPTRLKQVAEVMGAGDNGVIVRVGITKAGQAATAVPMLVRGGDFKSRCILMGTNNPNVETSAVLAAALAGGGGVDPAHIRDLKAKQAQLEDQLKQVRQQLKEAQAYMNEAEERADEAEDSFEALREQMERMKVSAR